MGHALYMALFILMTFNIGSTSLAQSENHTNTSNLHDLPAIFLFGDSLLDNGNNNYILTIARANFRPYGIDFFHSPTGRFSNGRNVGDIIAEGLGFKDFPPPYLAPSTSGNAILKGVNYASAFSGILEETGNLLYAFLSSITIGSLSVQLGNISMIGRVPLQQQILFFGQTKSQLINMLGESEANDLISKSIFVVASGSNDYINNYLFYLFPYSFDRFYYNPDAFRDHLIRTLSNQLTTLYSMGARKIVMAGIGPIGCTPFMRSVDPDSGQGCSVYSNNLVSDFNAEARKMISQLNRDMPDLIILHADTFSILYDIVANPLKYGFRNSDVACCGLGGRYHGIISCLPFIQFCGERSESVFWDAYHPTEAANILIANTLLKGDLSRIYPMNITQLAIL